MKANNTPSYTTEQHKAIDLRNRNILVSASAGAGKTAVLTERIVSLLIDDDHGIDIDSMIVVTFTRAAASEMRSRIGRKLTERLFENPGNKNIQKQLALLPHAQITTIDSFCMYVVRNYFYTISIDPAFRIGDTQEIQLIKNDVLDELIEEKYAEKDDKFVDMVETLVPGKNDSVIGEIVNTLYEYSRSHPWPEEWLNKCRDSFNISGVEGLNNSEWIIRSGIIEHINNTIKGASSKLIEACSICEKYEEFSALYSFIQEEYINIRNIPEGLSYSEYGEYLSKCEYKRFPSRSYKDELAVIKDNIKQLRDSSKTDINELKDDYYFADSDRIINDINSSSISMNELIDITLEFGERFAKRKSEGNIVDFSDIEHFALDILLKRNIETCEVVPTQAADEMMKQYSHILIDEYQDSNEVQETILTSFCRERIGSPNMFMVGDVKQSIYQFRLAKPDIFEAKRLSYTDDNSSNQRVLLKKNFRSTRNILSTVNYIFSDIMKKEIGNVDYDETQCFDIPEPTIAKRGGGSNEDSETESVDVIYITNEIARDENINKKELGEYGKKELEALAIAVKIKELTNEESGMKIPDQETGLLRPARYGDIVILLRSMSGWAEEFVDTLTLKGISAYAEERKGYLAAREIQIVLSYLKIIENPHQDIPFTAVLRSPYGKFSDDELVLIRSANREADMYTALLVSCEQCDQADCYTTLALKCRDFAARLEDLRNIAPYVKVHELIEKVLKIDDFIWNMEAMPSGRRRGGNLRMLIDKALEFEGNDNNGLFRFLEYIDKMKNSDIDFGEAEAGTGPADSGAVRIMSIHKSKGLEFPVVFVSGMGKEVNLMDARKRILVHSELGLAPDYFDYRLRVRRKTLLKKVISEKIVRDAFGEELRVLYVALTRPKLKLIITGFISNPDTKLQKYMKESGSYSAMLRGKGTYFKWLMPCFMRHPSWQDVCEDDIDAGNDNMRFPLMTFSRVTLDDLVINAVADEISNIAKKSDLLEISKRDIIDENVYSIIEEQKAYRYPYERETEFAVKVSVSEIKHRAAIDNQEEPVIAEWVQTERPEYIPKFIKNGDTELQGGAARGTFYHTLMQYLDLASVSTAGDIRYQIEKLIKAGVMPEEVLDKKIISVDKILLFCNSEVAKRMRTAMDRGRLFREQPFVMGINASKVYKDTISDETILVQGIIDVFFEEDDGMVLLDYKTDRLNSGEEKRLIDRYSAQMDCYSQAIEKNRSKPVKEIILYSFSLNKEIHL